MYVVPHTFCRFNRNVTSALQSSHHFVKTTYYKPTVRKSYPRCHLFIFVCHSFVDTAINFWLAFTSKGSSAWIAILTTILHASPCVFNESYRLLLSQHLRAVCASRLPQRRIIKWYREQARDWTQRFLHIFQIITKGIISCAPSNTIKSRKEAPGRSRKISGKNLDVSFLAVRFRNSTLISLQAIWTCGKRRHQARGEQSKITQEEEGTSNEILYIESDVNYLHCRPWLTRKSSRFVYYCCRRSFLMRFAHA